MYRMIGLALTLSLCTAATAADNMLNVKVGDAFPEVPLAAAQIDKAKKGATAISIADFKGKTVVVFFYPKALTSGCTVESCGFRDIAADFPAETILLGASADTVAKQQEFIDKEKLPYALLADTEMRLAKALGVVAANGKVSQRVTFVIDKEGKIAKIYETVTPAKHPKEVLAFVKGMK